MPCPFCDLWKKAPLYTRQVNIKTVFHVRLKELVQVPATKTGQGWKVPWGHPLVHIFRSLICRWQVWLYQVTVKGGERIQMASGAFTLNSTGGSVAQWSVAQWVSPVHSNTGELLLGWDNRTRHRVAIPSKPWCSWPVTLEITEQDVGCPALQAWRNVTSSKWSALTSKNRGTENHWWLLIVLAKINYF